MIYIKIKQYGLNAVPRGVKFLFRRCGLMFETFYLMRYELDCKLLQEKYRLFDYKEVQAITLDDLELYKNQFPSTKLALFKQRLLSQDYSCFGIVDGNQIIYYTWISWKHMNYPLFFKKQERLRKNEALLEDSYCDPRFRGRGLHSKMNIYRLTKMAEKGIEKALALVLAENYPAFLVQKKSGFNITKKIYFFKVGRWNWTKEKLIQKKCEK